MRHGTPCARARGCKRSELEQISKYQDPNMCFVGFIILNLFIGIIITEMQTAKEEAEKQRKTQNKLALATRLRIRQFDEKENSNSPRDNAAGSGPGSVLLTATRDTPLLSFDRLSVFESSDADQESGMREDGSRGSSSAANGGRVNASNPIFEADDDQSKFER